MNRHASIRVLFFFLVAGCGAFCQSSASTYLLDGSTSRELRRSETATWQSLPDAPSPKQPPAQTEGFHTFDNGSVGVLPGLCVSNCGYGYLPSKAPDFQTPIDKERLNETERRYVITLGLRHFPLADGSLIGIGRASSAVPSTVAMPNSSGRGKLNNSDFLGVVTSTAVRAAFHVGRGPLLRLSKSLIRPPATRGSTPSTGLGLAFGKK